MRVLLVLIALLSVTSALAQEVDDRQLKGQLSEAMNRKAWPEAARIAQLLLRYDRDEEWIWRCLSCAQRLMGQPEEAVESAREALRKKDTAWGNHDLLAALMDAGDFPQARAVARHALGQGRPYLGEVYDLVLRQYERIEERRYEWRFKLDPAKRRDKRSRTLRFRVPDPELDHQTAKTVITGVKRVDFVQENGSMVAEVEPNGSDPFEVVVDLVVKPTHARPTLRARNPKAALPREVMRFLRNEGYAMWGDGVLALAGELKGKDDLQTIERMVRWFKVEVKYATADEGKSAEDTLKTRAGHCHQQAKLFSALSRANGIPCRIVRMNWTKGSHSQVTWHSYVEVWMRGVGWMHVEPSDPWSIGIVPNNKLRIGTTFDDDSLKDSLESLRLGEPTWRRLPLG